MFIGQSRHPVGVDDSKYVFVSWGFLDSLKIQAGEIGILGGAHSRAEMVCLYGMTTHKYSVWTEALNDATTCNGTDFGFSKDSLNQKHQDQLGTFQTCTFSGLPKTHRITLLGTEGSIPCSDSPPSALYAHYVWESLAYILLIPDYSFINI